ncbi:MAG TPA: UbiD family decarboxylase, partial [Candidatus Binatia bacterium]|nr:UbiD family decarboxylase [Candidatus Binatia bacterium]
MGKSLGAFLHELAARLPCDLVRVEKAVSPADFEVTAILQHLENERRFPALVFEKPLNLRGEPSSFPLLSNVFATRSRCA